MATGTLDRDMDKLATYDAVSNPFAVDITPTEQMERFEAQYNKAVAALEGFGIETKGVPSWESIKSRITSEQLQLAKKLIQPALVLIPPMNRHQMVQAINNQKRAKERLCIITPTTPRKQIAETIQRHEGKYGIEDDTSTYDLEDDTLYNSGIPEGPEWGVSIVERVKNIPKNWHPHELSNHEQVKLLLRALKAKGLEPLSGARTYLATMMSALFDGEPIDVQTWTVLNAKVIERNYHAPLSYGCWSWGTVMLNRASASDQHSRAQVRGEIRITL